PETAVGYARAAGDFNRGPGLSPWAPARAAGYLGRVFRTEPPPMTRTSLSLALALACALAAPPAPAQDPPPPVDPQEQRDDDRGDNVELEQEALDRAGSDPAEAPLDSARGVRQDANGDGTDAKWNVEATQGQAKTVRFETSEGT